MRSQAWFLSCRGGDAIRARSLLTGRWMGGVVKSVDLLNGTVDVVAGKYDLEGKGVRCALYGSEVVHVGAVWVEIYRSEGLLLREEYRHGREERQRKGEDG